MPGRRPAVAIDQSLCRRCQIIEPSITVRNEPLCQPCFTKYVQSKVVKRMESFRVRHADPGHERRLLLPLSPDFCSLALLHVLSHQLEGQIKKTGRTGFKICVLQVRDETATDPTASAFRAELESRFPEHSYRTVQLAEALSEDLADLSPTALRSDNATPQEKLELLLRTSNSATSRQDLRKILTRRLVVACAKDMACEAVLCSESTTKLAERTLAETAKGRGLSLPFIVTDGDALHGVPFYYPLRELLNKELEAYVSFLEPAIDPGLIQRDHTPSVSTKNTTIDDLMQQYFASVEQEYPSIVANVVRTTSKLQADMLAAIEIQCELCDLPLLDGQAPDRSRLCYGCIRLLPTEIAT